MPISDGVTMKSPNMSIVLPYIEAEFGNPLPNIKAREETYKFLMEIIMSLWMEEARNLLKMNMLLFSMQVTKRTDTISNHPCQMGTVVDNKEI